MTPNRPSATPARRRTIHVADELWDAYAAICEEEGTTVSARLRAHMRQVVNRQRKDERQ